MGMELAQRVPALFEKQQATEKRRLLNFLLSNCTWKDGKLSAEFRQPFDILTVAAESHQSKKAAGAIPDDLFAHWLPGPMAQRTLVWDVFEYVFEAARRRIRPIRTYRSPVFLARGWANALESGKFQSRRAFAKAIGVSHARVSQVLGILRLCPRALMQIEGRGDPLASRAVTERKLRPLAALPTEAQEAGLRKMGLAGEA